MLEEDPELLCARDILGIAEQRFLIIRLIFAGFISTATLFAIIFYLWPQLPPSHRISTKIVVKQPIVEMIRYFDVSQHEARQINGRRPFTNTPLVLALPFKLTTSEISRSRAIDCAAAAAWYEAGDDAEGERSVVQTVLNRTRHPAFPNSVCGVVFQGSERKTGCQFTFTCDGSMIRTPSVAAWARARAIAAAALNGQVYAPVGLATHYHTDWVIPYWSAQLEKIARVRTHLFFRWPGYWGSIAVNRNKTLVEEARVEALARLSPAHADDISLATSTFDLNDTTVLSEQPATQSLTSTELGRVRQDRDGSVFFVQLDVDAFPGSYALKALEICRPHGICRVLGWLRTGQTPSALPLSADQRATLAFYYKRDDRSRSEQTLWNCKQLARQNSAQCLPVEADKLAALTR